MKKIGIVCAIENELAPYLACLENQKISKKSMVTFYQGKLGNQEVVVCYCGVCKVNAAIATQVMIAYFAVTAVIVSGTAGGIDPQLNIGDSVISTTVYYHDVADDILTEYHPWMPSPAFIANEEMINIAKSINFQHHVYFGKIVTGEAFIDTDGRKEIIEKYQPLAVDMETGSIAHVCYANAIPFLAVRSISDTEKESGNSTFEKNCDLASQRSFDVVEQLVKVI